MNTFFRFLLLAAIAFTAAGYSTAQAAGDAKAGPSNTASAAEYDTLLAKLKGGDTTVDFGKLRMDFAATKNYSYSGLDAAERGRMLKLLADQDYKAALKIAEKVLETNYVNPNAHYVAYISNRELKNADKAAFHKTVLLGLLESIKGKNDGQSAKTPFYVITIEEEYAVIRFLGYVVSSQSLQHQDGHAFDVFEVADPKTQAKGKLYFNIDPIWKAESELFSN